jgi:ubiquitin C-terminal hydrolase
LECDSTLFKSLKRNFEISNFDADNKYKCEECSKKTKAQFYQQLCFLPEVIVFHIKRFELKGKKIQKF